MVGTVHPPEEIGVNRPYLISVHSWLKLKVGKVFENLAPQFPEKEVKGRSNHEWTRINTNQKRENHGCHGLHRFELRHSDFACHAGAERRRVIPVNPCHPCNLWFSPFVFIRVHSPASP